MAARMYVTNAFLLVVVLACTRGVRTETSVCVGVADDCEVRFMHRLRQLVFPTWRERERESSEVRT